MGKISEFQKNVIMLIGLLAIIWLGLSFFGGNKSIDIEKTYDFFGSLERKTLEINGNVVDIEIADSPEAMEKGLGGREELKIGRGMWFVFPFDGRHGFWMKDMKFPIDIIWFDKNLKVVSIKENALPKSYPEIFYPQSESRYVLEVPVGFSQKNKIKISDRAEIFSEEP